MPHPGSHHCPRWLHAEALGRCDQVALRNIALFNRLAVAWSGRESLEHKRLGALPRLRPPIGGASLESSLESRDQVRQGFRLLMRGQVTAGQPLDLEAELAQPFLGEVDLPMFERIFIAATDKERELVAVSLEEGAEVEPIALGFVIGIKTRCRR
jgi:hypothetical protein